MRSEKIDRTLCLTHDDDPKIRRTALLELCPCHVRNNLPKIWDRIFQMQYDADPTVRSIVLHNLCDGSPRERIEEVVHSLERLAHDPNLKLRRRARRALSTYNQTGRIAEA